MTWTTLTDFAFDSDTGRLWDTGCSWPCFPQSLKVTYTHGYEIVPDGLINAACRFAQQYLENPALLLQRGMGQINDRYAGNTGVVGIVINEFDKQVMDRYTLNSVG